MLSQHETIQYKIDKETKIIELLFLRKISFNLTSWSSTDRPQVHAHTEEDLIQSDVVEQYRHTTSTRSH